MKFFSFRREESNAFAPVAGKDKRVDKTFNTLTL
jgi:hypothetical protein